MTGVHFGYFANGVYTTKVHAFAPRNRRGQRERTVCGIAQLHGIFYPAAQQQLECRRCIGILASRKS